MSEHKRDLTNIGLLWLRIFSGLGIAYHGYGKIFGGYIERLIAGVGNMGFPAPDFFAWAAALSEFLGGLFLALGLLTHQAAFFVFMTMTVAVCLVHGTDPIQKQELALAYLTISGALMCLGGGKYSLDYVLFCKKCGCKK